VIAATMRHLVGQELGRTDLFKLATAEIPEPARGQVRLRVEATALGFVDGLIVTGRYQIKPELPYVPGGEIAGTIDSIGPDVDGFAIGDRVAIWQLGGGVAEFALAVAKDLIRIPDRLGSGAAAAMIVDYLTAHYALFDRGSLKAGETVLVLGAAGGVGAAAVHLAARAGAHVVAAASSPEKRQRGLALGARASVDYSVENWRGNLRNLLPASGLNLVVDPVGGAMLEPAFRSLAKGGRHLVLGFAGGEIARLPVNLALIKSASLIGVDVRHLTENDMPRARGMWRALFAQAADGTIDPPGYERHPLAKAEHALARAMARDKRGKIVITC
jgi:NADPH2:quinone reductase